MRWLDLRGVVHAAGQDYDCHALRGERTARCAATSTPQALAEATKHRPAHHRLAGAIHRHDRQRAEPPQPWLRHGRQVFKDRGLKLPVQPAPVRDEYVRRYRIAGRFFPYTQRFLSQLIAQAAEAASVRKR